MKLNFHPVQTVLMILYMLGVVFDYISSSIATCLHFVGHSKLMHFA